MLATLERSLDLDGHLRLLITQFVIRQSVGDLPVGTKNVRHT